jgi:RNA polymerase sigma factor (sigma-70 family)
MLKLFGRQQKSAPESLSDAAYVEGLRTGDSQVIEAIYARFSPHVIRWIEHNSGDRAGAKDIFQEALITIHGQVQNSDFKLHCSFGYFLEMICRRRWIDQLRKKKREQGVRKAELERISTEEEVEAGWEQMEQEVRKYELLEKTFQELSETCQQLLKLVQQGLSGTKIAQQMNMNSANTVYQRRHACVQRWTQLFQTEMQH